MSDWNRVLILRRLRGPALLLLTGVIALLDQMNILSWGHAWPLYLILLGVLALAERAALATLSPYADPYADPYAAAAYPPYPGYPPAGPGAATAAAGQPNWTENAAQSSSTEPGIVPVNPLTAIAATPAPIDAQQAPSHQPRRFWNDESENESGKESRS